jgi:hypothetical protein
MPRIESLGLEGAPLVRAKRGQCLLAFAGWSNGDSDTLWALSHSTDQANTLWLDNLYLRYASCKNSPASTASILVHAAKQQGQVCQSGQSFSDAHATLLAWAEKANRSMQKLHVTVTCVCFCIIFFFTVVWFRHIDAVLSTGQECRCQGVAEGVCICWERSARMAARMTSGPGLACT